MRWGPEKCIVSHSSSLDRRKRCSSCNHNFRSLKQIAKLILSLYRLKIFKNDASKLTIVGDGQRSGYRLEVNSWDHVGRNQQGHQTYLKCHHSKSNYQIDWNIWSRNRAQKTSKHQIWDSNSRKIPSIQMKAVRKGKWFRAHIFCTWLPWKPTGALAV